MQYIGPATEFGGCNPLNGNFTALVLPLCKPERLQLVAYVLECRYLPRQGQGTVLTPPVRLKDAFLHDKFMEEVDASAVRALPFLHFSPVSDLSVTVYAR